MSASCEKHPADADNPETEKPDEMPRRSPSVASMRPRTTRFRPRSGAAVRDIDETKAPLLEHLIELRRRLLWWLAARVAFFVCLYFAKNIFAVLVQPLLPAGQGKLIYTDIFEAFFVEVKVALFAALMLGFPVLATQLWRFVAPGLYAKEKKALPAVPVDDSVFLRRRRVPSPISWRCRGRCISC